MTRAIDHAQAHSVWLVPEPDAEHRLNDLIHQLSGAYELDCFAPHITLLGDFDTAPKLTALACQKYLETCGPIEARVSNVARTRQHFMSLFFDVTLSVDLSAQRASIFETVAGRKPADFRPHVSLAYGLELTTKLHAKDLANIGKFVGTHMCFDRLCVVKSSKAIPVKQWRVLSEFDLNNFR